MKNIFILIASLFVINAATAQEQSAVFSHYFLNPILVNPAVAGFDDMHKLQMNIRSQWTGFPESPKSHHIGYNGPIGKTLGIGLGLMSENLGNRSNLRFQMNYAFRYSFKNVKFGAGFSTEFHTLKVAESVSFESGVVSLAHGDSQVAESSPNFIFQTCSNVRSFLAEFGGNGCCKLLSQN